MGNWACDPAAREVIDGPFAMINADDFMDMIPISKLLLILKESAPPGEIDHYCMVGHKLANTLSDHGDVNRGLCGRRRVVI